MSRNSKWDRVSGPSSFTTALRPVGTIRNAPGRFLRRNEPCPCGSGQKYKKCCYEPRPASLAFLRQWGFMPSGPMLQLYTDGKVDELREAVVELLQMQKAPEKLIEGVKTLGFLVTHRNLALLTAEQLQSWKEVTGERTLPPPQVADSTTPSRGL